MQYRSQQLPIRSSALRKVRFADTAVDEMDSATQHQADTILASPNLHVSGIDEDFVIHTSFLRSENPDETSSNLLGTVVNSHNVQQGSPLEGERRVGTPLTRYPIVTPESHEHKVWSVAQVKKYYGRRVFEYHPQSYGKLPSLGVRRTETIPSRSLL